MEVFWVWSNGSARDRGRDKGPLWRTVGSDLAAMEHAMEQATAAVQGTRCIEVR